MKNLLTKHVLSFGIALILITGCNSSTKTKVEKGKTSSGQKASVEVEVFDAVKVKDQIVETIRKMPGEKPSQPLRGDEFRDFLKQSAEKVKTWPDWVRGDQRAAVPAQKPAEGSTKRPDVQPSVPVLGRAAFRRR